ncbi:hypothetical protein BDP27DRAFT_1299179 [Rhodocollybia butyracea]|uniref:Uncharacterized protein n=1 Tax=Rhodocollybia butyracea TaxID=206335 RepID=A0A9P5U340_9AGAR|nr:hypothetical protein BDP27DRAFT_1299179 [Rhodocollybia butyracea]
MKKKGYGPLVPCTTVQNCTSVKVNCGLEDLPNLTPRCLLGNDTARFFLQSELQHLQNPAFSDLHPSLGNLDHLQVYICRAILTIHPHGTGWEGLLNVLNTLNSNACLCVSRASSFENRTGFYMIGVQQVYSPCLGVSPFSQTR